MFGRKWSTRSWSEGCGCSARWATRTNGSLYRRVLSRVLLDEQGLPAFRADQAFRLAAAVAKLGDRHACAQVRQDAGRLPADALPRARDHGDLAGESTSADVDFIDEHRC